MTKPYSEDLRIRAVEAVANGMSRRQVAKVFKVGVSSVIRWTQLVGSKNSNGRVAVSQAASVAVPEAAQYNFADGS